MRDRVVEEASHNLVHFKATLKDLKDIGRPLSLSFPVKFSDLNATNN